MQKQCPRCSTPSALDAPSCTVCGHVYRTKFVPPSVPAPTILLSAQLPSPNPTPTPQLQSPIYFPPPSRRNFPWLLLVLFISLALVLVVVIYHTVAARREAVVGRWEYHNDSGMYGTYSNIYEFRADHTYTEVTNGGGWTYQGMAPSMPTPGIPQQLETVEHPATHDVTVGKWYTEYVHSVGIDTVSGMLYVGEQFNYRPMPFEVSNDGKRLHFIEVSGGSRSDYLERVPDTLPLPSAPTPPRSFDSP